MKRILLTLTCILTFYGSIQAQFSGPGTGTEDAPYRISNPEELNQVRNFLRQSDVYFILEADIDMTDWIAENNPSQGWTPIGTVDKPFTGKFNGNGYRIKNLVINRPETDYIGLFGYISNDCEITNITIENANYTGHDFIGGIAGFCDVNSSHDQTPLNSCSIYGKITGNNNVGGIVGKYNCENSGNPSSSEANIYECFSCCLIKGNENVGGIIGVSRAIGNTLGFREYYGNLYLKRCLSISNIYGIKNVGGIIGKAESYKNGKISIGSSYVSSPIIEGEENVGGILGGSLSYNNVNIYSCYSCCEKILGNNNVGGIIGFGDDVYNSYVDKTSANNSVAINNEIYAKENLYRICPEGMDNSSGNLAWTLTKMILDGKEQPMPEDGIANGTNTGLSALKLKATYQGLGWDFDNIWQIRGDEDFPYLKVQTANLSITNELHAGDTRIEGSCIENGTITVCVGDKTYTTQSNGNSWSIDVDELIAGEKVIITVQADGKMPSRTASTTVKYAGKGTAESPFLISTAEELHNISDSGYYKLTTDIDVSNWSESNGWSPIGDKLLGVNATLDGDGHTISGLRYDTEFTKIGLFGTIAKDGAVKNLKIKLLESCALTDESIFGAIASVNNGTISNCEVTGLNVTDGLYVGGIVGENTGVIERCHTEGIVKTISREVTRAGGICGNMPDGVITNCYSDVSLYCGLAETYVGGIVGYTDGTVNCCYATGALEGDIIGGIAGFAGGSSGTDKELKNCFALNESLLGQKSYRIVGGNSWVLVDNNYSREDLRGGDLETYRDGESLPVSELKAQATYESAGWDFTNVWKIDEGTSWPYQEAFNVPVTSISVSETEANIEAGKTLELTVTIAPDDARNKTVTWSSSDETVATVSQEGTVTAVKAGEATITATTNDGTGLTASCIVKVNETSGIGNVYADGITVAGGKGCITISGTADNIMTSVYTANGTTVYTGTDTTISVGAPGLYIVKTDGNTYKVIVK